jgi:hypothetical protein
LYIISRSDLPIAHQAVQAAHAGIEYARTHDLPEHPTLIHLSARDSRSLEHLRHSLHEQEIDTASFYESYSDWGLTAIACLADKNQKYFLSHLPLWSAS